MGEATRAGTEIETEIGIRTETMSAGIGIDDFYRIIIRFLDSSQR